MYCESFKFVMEVLGVEALWCTAKTKVSVQFSTCVCYLSIVIPLHAA